MKGKKNASERPVAGNISEGSNNFVVVFYHRRFFSEKRMSLAERSTLAFTHRRDLNSINDSTYKYKSG